MRKAWLFLVAVILVAAACGSGPSDPGRMDDEQMEMRRR